MVELLWCDCICGEGDGEGPGDEGGVSDPKWAGFEAWNLLLISSGSFPLIMSATVRQRMSSRDFISK